MEDKVHSNLFMYNTSAFGYVYMFKYRNGF